MNFDVSQEQVLQMLPMYAETVMRCISKESELSSEYLILDFDAQSIWIEMVGRN